jgi:hypothetical protein
VRCCGGNSQPIDGRVCGLAGDDFAGAFLPADRKPLAYACSRTCATDHQPYQNVTFRYVAPARDRPDGAAMETKLPAPRLLDRLNKPAAEPSPNARRIGAKVRRAIELMASGDAKTITDAAAKVGLARESLSRALDKPHVQDYGQQKARRTISLAAARAAQVKAELLDSNDSIARDRSSSFILGVAGIAPATTPGIALNIEAKAGYVILLADDPPQAHTIDHE